MGIKKGVKNTQHAIKLQKMSENEIVKITWVL